MNINRGPKFGKVELLLKNTLNTNDLTSITKIEFFDCGLMITGDFIVVTIDENHDNTLTSTGKIFHLNEVSAYKTHAQ